MLVIVASDVCWALFSCCSSRFTSSLVASRLFLVDTNCDCRHIMDIYNTMTCNTLHNNIYYHTGSESCTCGPGLKGVHMYRYETSRQLAWCQDLPLKSLRLVCECLHAWVRGYSTHVKLVTLPLQHLHWHWPSAWIAPKPVFCSHWFAVKPGLWLIFATGLTWLFLKLSLLPVFVLSQSSLRSSSRYKEENNSSHSRFK